MKGRTNLFTYDARLVNTSQISNHMWIVDKRINYPLIFPDKIRVNGINGSKSSHIYKKIWT